jgi:predicted nicotinamide N-methyase
VTLNAELNGVALEFAAGDPIGDPLRGFDVVVAGDVFYEKPLAERSMVWFRELAARGATVLAGDPGRNYSPTVGFSVRAWYDVPTTLEIEGREILHARVLEIAPRSA